VCICQLSAAKEVRVSAEGRSSGCVAHCPAVRAWSRRQGQAFGKADALTSIERALVALCCEMGPGMGPLQVFGTCGSQVNQQGLRPVRVWM
jgi:hypothetical protein